MKLAIVGNGAIGNLVAANAKDKKIDFALLTRTGLKLQLSIEHFDTRKQQFSPEIRKIDRPGDFDILVLPLKAYQIVPTLKQLLLYIRPQHTIVLLHNGMGTIEKVTELLPHNPIVAATTTCGAYKPAENRLMETGIGENHGGWVSQNKGDYRAQIEALLALLLGPYTWHEDIQLALWRKLAINAIINPLTAINHIRNGELSDTKYQQAIQQMCAETAQVMLACGYPTNQVALYENVLQIVHNTAANFSSMNRDIAFKRPTEIDFINGYIVAEGRKFNIQTPCNIELFNAIKQFEAKY